MFNAFKHNNNRLFALESFSTKPEGKSFSLRSDIRVLRFWMFSKFSHWDGIHGPHKK